MVSNDVLLKLLQKSNSKFALLKLLEKEPCYVREISTKMEIFPSAIVKHIRFLEDANLIDSEEVENRKYYKLTQFGKKLLNLLKKTT